MGTLRELQDGRDHLESSTDEFGSRYDGENVPHNSWYYIDHTGKGWYVNDTVESILSELEEEYEDDFNILELHNYLIEHEPDKFSEIVVTTYKRGSEETKVAKYLTYNPSLLVESPRLLDYIEDPLGRTESVEEEMAHAARELWGQETEEEEEVDTWDAGEWLNNGATYRHGDGTATIGTGEPDCTITHESTDAELRRIAEEIDDEAELEGVFVVGTYEYLCDLREDLEDEVED